MHFFSNKLCLDICLYTKNKYNKNVNKQIRHLPCNEFKNIITRENIFLIYLLLKYTRETQTRYFF